MLYYFSTQLSNPNKFNLVKLDFHSPFDLLVRESFISIAAHLLNSFHTFIYYYAYHKKQPIPPPATTYRSLEEAKSAYFFNTLSEEFDLTALHKRKVGYKRDSAVKALILSCSEGRRTYEKGAKHGYRKSARRYDQCYKLFVYRQHTARGRIWASGSG